MMATTFRDRSARVGQVVMLGGLFGDAALWQVVLCQAAASRPCTVSQGGGYHMEGAMAVAAMSQDGGSPASPALVNVEP